MDTLQLACHEAEAWKLAQILPENIWDVEARAAKEKEVDGQDRRERWRCMIDASWTLEDTGVGLDFIMFDGTTEIMRGQRKRSNSSSPLHAEAEGLVWVMEELSSRGFKQVRFESDCQQMVHIINSSKQWPTLEPELDAIESLRETFISFTLSFIS
ncbi:hypothetical protein DY000_02026370 [Brassica cretica]|uniref:RNase H type-1 domain-containing protein n=1 Tax=Brassica cretica TaxID=69181 RepID=A0ABQ7E6Z8_BRACR|nr:hypothetical protein DY000_02026370 [Brassica cretica]